MNLLQRARFGRDHRWAPKRMSAYLDAELDAQGRGRMERHISHCDECRRLLAGLRRMLDALRRVPARGGEAEALALVASVRARLEGPAPAE